MRPLIRVLFVAAFAAITVAATLPQAIADDSTGSEQDRFAARQTLGLAAPPKLATEMFRGVVAGVNQSNDTIRIIRRSSDTAEELKVQDGLIFNSVRYGDQVEVTVENLAGTRTIVGLTKQ
jgi:hypothetical protein